VVSTDKITFLGSNIYLRGTVDQSGITSERIDFIYVSSSVMTGNFTFTSPTVYIAHPAIVPLLKTTALNPASFNSSTQPDYATMEGGIVALKENEVFLLRPHRREITNGTNYALMVAQGKFSPMLFHNEEIQFDIVPLDYENQENSIPADVYFDARYEDCWDQQSHCSTITDDNYYPDLVVPKRVWESYYSGPYDCPYFILPDPPVVLWPISIMDQPSLLDFTATISSFGTKISEPPKPGQRVRPDHPSPTPLSQQEDIPERIYPNWPGPGISGEIREGNPVLGEYVGQGSQAGAYGGKTASRDGGPTTRRPASLDFKNPGSWSGAFNGGSLSENEGSENAPSSMSLHGGGSDNGTSIRGNFDIETYLELARNLSISHGCVFLLNGINLEVVDEINSQSKPSLRGHMSVYRPHHG
jgi:hypothetical protein